MSNKLILTKEQFEQYYYDEKLTYKEIGKRFGCTPSAVMRKGRKFGIIARQACKAPQSMEGMIFGSLTVIHRDGNKIVCKCNCGEIIYRNPYDIKRGDIKLCPSCKSTFLSNLNWRGYEEISGDYWGSLQDHAIRRDYEFSVRIEYAWSLYLEQDKKCALSGVPISFSRQRKKHASTASLDRIDSSIGYVNDNIQWVHKTINRMKLDFQQSEFIEWCRRIAQMNS